MIKKAFPRLLAWALLLSAGNSYGLYFDGKGHYAVRAHSQSNPGFNKGGPKDYQALDQSFYLNGEIRLNDQSSYFIGFHLFPPAGQHLGDDPSPHYCSKEQASCTNGPQNISDPGYKPYIPQVDRAYIRYATDYCIIEAGRRPRAWGLGMLFDKGETPFSPYGSMYDGITCNVKMKKSDTLQFALGYDKLGETGKPFPQLSAAQQASIQYGANNSEDDIDQYFLTIEYDDRASSAGTSLTKKVGIYAAKIKSGSVNDGGYNTDIIFADFYTGFYLNQMSLEFEVLVRQGHTADPSASLLGGATIEGEGVATNKVDSIAGTGQLEWALSTQSGQKYRLVSGFSYAPGDPSGYYQGGSDSIGIFKRSTSAKAMAFHGNFSPALILFNSPMANSALTVDGVFDPTRLMNASLFNLGVKFETDSYGEFLVNVFTGWLNTDIPADVKAFYAQQDQKVVGYYGDDLGYEIDLSFKLPVANDFDIGTHVAYLLPGKALQTADSSLKSSLLLRADLTFTL